jgi:hypothetical protein
MQLTVILAYLNTLQSGYTVVGVHYLNNMLLCVLLQRTNGFSLIIQMETVSLTKKIIFK